jgi:transglutaminase-like putative cysteine protease
LNYLIQAECRMRLAAPVREHHIQLRLAPWVDAWQSVEQCSFEIEPFAELIYHRDGFGNPVHNLAILKAHREITLGFRAQVQTLMSNPFDYAPIAPERELAWIGHSLRQAPRLWDFVLQSAGCAHGMAEPVAAGVCGVKGDEPIIERVQAAMQWIDGRGEAQQEERGARIDTGAPVDDAYGGSLYPTLRLISLVRGWGVPARFAVGYVDPDLLSPQGQEGAPQPQCMRAWADVLVPGAGWRGFDPAAGLVVNDTYVRVAAGRGPNDVVAERVSFKGDCREAAVAWRFDVVRR